MKSVWITWEEQRRNKPIAEYFSSTFFQLNDIRKYSLPTRYLVGIYKTLKIFLKEKPDVAFVQNPSIVLAAFTVATKNLFRHKVVVDTHNGGFAVNPKDKLRFIKRWIQRNADLIIAHNPQIASKMAYVGGNVGILPDKLPIIEEPKDLRFMDKSKFNFLYICSFADDEPYQEVMNAFRYLGPAYHVHITGNFSKIKNFDFVYPQNIHLYGRVSWERYDQLLHSVDAVIVQTKRDDCLQCGAYEAVAVEKPMILSKTKALKEYFYKGAHYTIPESHRIANAIELMAKNLEQHKSDVVGLKNDLTRNWPILADAIFTQIGESK